MFDEPNGGKKLTEKDVLEILEMLGAIIIDDHIVYASDKHGTKYVNKDFVYPDTGETSKLCRMIAEHFKDSGIGVVIGPEKGAIILSTWTANHLTLMTGRKVIGVYAEREEISLYKQEKDKTSADLYLKDTFSDLGRLLGGQAKISLEIGDEVILRKPGFVVKRGYDKKISGKKVLVVEDVLTTGNSVRKVIKAVLKLGCEVVGVGAICNRGAVTLEDVGVSNLFSCVNIKMEAYEPDQCPECATGKPINLELGHGKAFVEKYGQPKGKA